MDAARAVRQPARIRVPGLRGLRSGRRPDGGVRGLRRALEHDLRRRVRARPTRLELDRVGPVRRGTAGALPPHRNLRRRLGATGGVRRRAERYHLPQGCPRPDPLREPGVERASDARRHGARWPRRSAHHDLRLRPRPDRHVRRRRGILRHERGLGAVACGHADLDTAHARGYPARGAVVLRRHLRSAPRSAARVRRIGAGGRERRLVPLACGRARMDRAHARGPDSGSPLRAHRDLRSGARPDGRVRRLLHAAARRRLDAVAGGGTRMERDLTVGCCAGRQVFPHRGL